LVNCLLSKKKLLKIGEVGNLFRGVTYGKSDARSKLEKGFIPILRANNIFDNKLNFDKLVYVPENKVSVNQKVKKGDIIFCMSSGSKRLVGKSALSNEDFEGSFGAFCSLFRVNKNVKGKFISYYFQSENFRRYISKKSKGTNINNLKREHILEATVNLPSINEQELIVAEIETQFTRLDFAIESLQTIKKKLEVYRKSILKNALTGKNTIEWRENNNLNSQTDEIKFLVEQNIKNDKRKSNGKSMFEDYDLEKYPIQWFFAKLKDISTKITDGTHKTPKYTDSGIKFISVKNIYNNKVNFKNCKFISEKEHKELFKRCNPEKNDLLITKSGTIGRTAIVDTNFEFSLFVSVALIKPINSIVLSKYLELAVADYMNKVNIDKSIKGALVKNYHLEDLREMLLPICSLKEQEKIIEYVETQFSVIDKLEEAINASLLKVETLRKSILKSAFEGKLVRYDNND